MPSPAETKAAKQRDKRARYMAICTQHGVAPVGAVGWSQHMAELLDTAEPKQPPLTKEDMRAFWLERLTQREINEMARWIYPVSEGGQA